MKPIVRRLLCGGVCGVGAAALVVALQHREPAATALEDPPVAAVVGPESRPPGSTGGRRVDPLPARPDAFVNAGGNRTEGAGRLPVPTPSEAVGTSPREWASAPPPDASSRNAHGTPGDLTQGESRGTPGSHQSGTAPGADRPDLVQRALQVENQANRELERLIPLLDLTPEQQDRVFDILVRHSSDFLPAMIAAGSDGTPLTEPAESSTVNAEAPADSGSAVVDAAEPVAASDPGSRSASAVDKPEPEPSAGDVLAAVESEGASRKANGVAGRRPKARQEELLEVLTMEQGVELLGSEAAQSEWWQDVIGYMEAQIEDVPVPGDPAAAAEDEPPAPAYGGN